VAHCLGVRPRLAVGLRHFILTLHSDLALKVHMQRAISPVFSQRVDELELMTDGVRRTRIGSLDLHCLKANAFTCGVFNIGPWDVNCELDCSQSTEVGFSIGTEKSRHKRQSGSWEILNYIRTSSNAQPMQDQSAAARL
jgi:hypothetical protein